MSRITINNSYYFLTTPTFNHEKYFNTEKRKIIVLNQFKKIKDNLEIPIYAYSIACNHYHCLFYLKNKNDLRKVVQILNGGSSFILNKIDGKNRRIWDNYWTKIIIEETMFYNVLGYIIGNLLKHKEVKNFKELNISRFSSFSQIVKKYGFEFAEEMVKSVIRLDLEDDAKFEINNGRLKPGK